MVNITYEVRRYSFEHANKKFPTVLVVENGIPSVEIYDIYASKTLSLLIPLVSLEDILKKAKEVLKKVEG